jgi:hypothetical protein
MTFKTLFKTAGERQPEHWIRSAIITYSSAASYGIQAGMGEAFEEPQ